MPHIQADSCPVSEYLAGDDDIPICEEFDNEHWEEFYHHLHPQVNQCQLTQGMKMAMMMKNYLFLK